jgi:aromatic ring-cleaving dioxygenase
MSGGGALDATSCRTHNWPRQRLGKRIGSRPLQGTRCQNRVGPLGTQGRVLVLSPAQRSRPRFRPWQGSSHERGGARGAAAGRTHNKPRQRLGNRIGSRPLQGTWCQNQVGPHGTQRRALVPSPAQRSRLRFRPWLGSSRELGGARGAAAGRTQIGFVSDLVSAWAAGLCRGPGLKTG